MAYQEKLSDGMRRQRFQGTPSQEDELRAVRRQALEGMRRLDEGKDKKPAPAAADEMWLLGGPETTEQGGFALARAKKRRARRAAIGVV